MLYIFQIAFFLSLTSPYLAKIIYQERFDSGNLDSWVQSTHKGADAGKFILSAGKFYGDASKDIGIKTSEDARFYGLSAEFKPASSQTKPIVIQFTVKHEQNIDCGGGYLKIFDCSLDQKDMHGDSPYKIMFGPDICGPGTKKVHVIFNHKGENHLIKKDIRCKDDVYTHLYTLILNSNEGTYSVLIDNEKVESGNLEEDWDFLPSKTIKDPSAVKPEDWDERAKIDDPEDSKPDDWDKAEHIPDPEATKPEDWDDEMDGEWEPAMIDNPEYKGEWTPRQIDNPDYKGKWIHPEIPNPEYKAEEAKTLAKYPELCKIGFDLWQVKAGTIFDNILITDDVEEAKKIGNELWGATKDPEHKMKEAQDEEDKAKAEEETKNSKEEEEEDDEDLDDVDEDEDKESHDEL